MASEGEGDGEGPRLPPGDAVGGDDGYGLIALAMVEWAVGGAAGKTLGAPGLPMDHPLVEPLLGRGARLVAVEGPHAAPHPGELELLVTSGWLDGGDPPGTGNGQALQHVRAAAWVRPRGLAIHHLPSRRFRLRREELVALGWQVLRGASADPPGPALQKARAAPPPSRRRQMVRYHLGNLLVLQRLPAR